ncbi:MAG: NADH-ubiquinone oxidoreductase [Methanomicrobiales archaeon HGW-Methanomicrobiales-4]|nr:MAG: NADH-ubiquinone oxidoreductase [Methanomicrobiales archaeon HGW-Methanomicrobiales-4]
MIELIAAGTIVGLLFHGIHRKVIARIQGRPGPPIWQEIFHTLKFSFKQTWVPKTASNPLFVFIVAVELAIWTGAIFIVGSGGNLLMLFAVFMLHKIVEHGLGLSSGSPYGKFAAIRSVMSAASEIPLFATIGGLYLITGSLSISDIIEWQQVHGSLIIPAFPLAFAMYLVILSKMHYGPFSITKAKEIVSGVLTEHFGVFRAGLDVAFAMKTFVLIWAFILIFIGALPWWLMLIAMLMVLISLSFVCAFTPMLTPYDTVAFQALISALLVVYLCIFGVIL